jgi:hypothetical protein
LEYLHIKHKICGDWDKEEAEVSDVKKRVYLDAGTVEQFNRVVNEYKNQAGGDLDYVFLLDASQITPEQVVNVWRCRELDRQLLKINCEESTM